MTFSQYLKIIYENRNSTVSLQSDFLCGLVNSTGGNFDYQDDYFKKIFNGSKKLTDDFRNCTPKDYNFKPVFDYLKSCIDPNRLNDLLRDFGIPEDEKKDLDILIEALVYKFAYFMDYGDNDTAIVANIYFYLLDQYGNGKIENANEKALCAALNYFLQAINAVASIKTNEDLLSLERPFENCFDSIYKSFKIYNQKCTHEGREMLKYFKKQILDGTIPEVDNYLNRVTEPGIEPIELVKEIRFTIYDNYTFKDKELETSILIDDKSEKEKVLEEFKNFKFYPTNEIYFTENISFREKDKKENLLLKIDCIFDRLIHIFNSIRINLKKEYDQFEKIDKELKKAFNDYKLANIQYLTDGTYYPDTGEISFAPTIEFGLGSNESGSFKIHDTKQPMKTNPMFTHIINLPFEEQVKGIAAFRGFMWEHIKFSDELFGELYLINPDGTFRLFAAPITCKARIYRMIRDAHYYAYGDKSTAFIFSSLMVFNYYEDNKELNKLFNMRSEERDERGIDMLVTVGYKDGKLYSYSNVIDDIKNDIPPREIDFEPHIFVPLLRSVIYNSELIKKEKK